MKYHHLISLILLLKIILLHNLTMGQTNYKIYGHRGCRGLYPENTITGFEKAIELGVDGIEIDVVVNKDSQLIISHEPFIDTNYCIVLKSSSENLNIYKMNLDEIRKIDCGSKVLNRFPQQEKTVERKPSFKEFESHFNNYDGEILFEIKCEPKLIGKYYPEYKSYANFIYNETINSKLINNITFMSFDVNILNELHKRIPDSKYVLLLDSYNIEKIESLNFKEVTLGINHEFLDLETIHIIKNKHYKIYAWTVNSKDKFEKLVAEGVEGIITDYPNIITK